MNQLTIAIQQDHQQLSSKRWQSFSTRWHELAAQQGLTTQNIDIFSDSINWLDQLQGCDGFMWWFGQPLSVSRPGRRLIAALAHINKIPTFPNHNTIWHFDDKVAQSYLLQLADIPTPKTWVFWSKSQADKFINLADYPLVLKLSSGVISKNVELVHNRCEASHHAHALFGSGMYALPPANLPFRWFARRASEAIRVFLSRKTDEEFHKGYLLLQEFLPENDFDIRVTIIGNRAFAFRRYNRPGDFRASGSGRIDWNPAQIPSDSLLLAFQTAKILQTQSLAVDILRRNSKPVIAEISYYYEGWAIEKCPGHWKLSDQASQPVWVEGSMRPEDAIWEDFITQLH
ncbi:RimK-like ATP-grasp domain-containing protein [Nitrosomonas eutropha]|uniref:RimK-like ATP-grasp domain-containing protein n=1 Tax=Nitrosomonas eutropha TaxID=916 RepID=A0A1I7GT61_9PROT|nr:hypothetical protein [Nitrosomonas eutropha]SFU51581.1 RimK-like ATP-grasp domain-containing protein [Nitrosomonas eutropha]